MNWYQRAQKMMVKTASLQKRSDQEFWGTEASGLMIVCMEDRTMLLSLRSGVEQSGTWGIPGGAVQTDDRRNEQFYDSEEIIPEEHHVSEAESFESAKNETMEEIGVMPSSFTQIGKTVFQKGGFKYVTFIISVPLEEKRRMSFNQNYESADVRWFPFNKLPKRLHFGVVYTIKNAGGIFS